MPTRKGSLLACSVQNCSRSVAALDTCRPHQVSHIWVSTCLHNCAHPQACPNPHLYAVDACFHSQLLHCPSGLSNVTASGHLARHLGEGEKGCASLRLQASAAPSGSEDARLPASASPILLRLSPQCGPGFFNPLPSPCRDFEART